MPTVNSPAKVLVSGANGFVAIWVVKTLLNQGYAVRGTVRSEAKGKHLVKLFESYGDKFELAVVPDITIEGAFDDAVRGVDAIEHTASPFHFGSEDPKDYVEPAVKGTTGILKSALAHGSKVKRIVITSSTASLFSFLDTPKEYNEEDWNDQSIQTLEKEGRQASSTIKYCASKTLAEKAAWDFWKAHREQVQWDLVVLTPPWVFGPVIHEVSRPEDLNTSTKTWFDAVVRPDSGGMTKESLASSQGAWIDVRDLAEAHVASLNKEAAGGERIIILKDHFSLQDFLDVANKVSYRPNLAKGVPGGGATEHHIFYRTNKEATILGINKRTREETTQDILEDFEKKGW